MESKSDKLFSTAEMLIGVIGLIGILIITAGVVSRFILQVSISWTDELLRTLFIYGYFIGAAVVYHDGGLMRLELLELSLAKRNKLGLKRVFQALVSLVVGAFLLFLAIGIAQIVIPFIQSGTTTSTSQTPAWVLPVGYGVGVLLMLMVVVMDLREMWSRKAT